MKTLADISRDTHEYLKNHIVTLSTAESCTGGLVASSLTDFAGSSVYFDRGFVTYSNNSKQAMLGVGTETLEVHGAVSEATAIEMAEGARQRSNTDCALSITGIAGPDGGSVDKPVGTVCFAWARRHQATISSTRHFDGDRGAVRVQAAIHALSTLISLLSAKPS